MESGLPGSPAGEQHDDAFLSVTDQAVPSLHINEDDLWTRWSRHQDWSARAILAERYVPYARALAARCFARRGKSEFEFDDYFHYAIVGMMESLDRFSLGRGAQFTTFAMPRINGAILNGLERLSERQQQISFRRRLDRDRIESLKGDSLAQQPGQVLLTQLSDIGVGLALSFLLEGTGMVLDPADRLPDNAYAHVELQQLREEIWRVVERLTARETQVIRRHYLQQQSFDEIAKALQLTKGRISQLHTQGLKRIRKLLEASGRCALAC
jgi:RNA polymerase sigma factor for flagellar operon FliA